MIIMCHTVRSLSEKNISHVYLSGLFVLVAIDQKKKKKQQAAIKTTWAASMNYF